MYLVQSHGGCPADFVYLVAVENMNVVCNWERFNQAEIPKILYANGAAASNGYDCKFHEMITKTLKTEIK